MFIAALQTALLAATMVPQSLEQLTDRATHVIRATIISSDSRRAPGPAGIYTFTEFRVVEQLKGPALPTVIVRQPGGTVGREKVSLPGDASFEPGEEVLAFLTCRPGEETCSVVALAQGKFHLARAADGPTVATRDFHDVAFVKGEALTEGPELYAELARRIRLRAGAQH